MNGRQESKFPFTIDASNTPQADVALEIQTSAGSWQRFQFELDTGAYITTLPASAATILGVNLTDGEKLLLTGVNGTGFDVYIHKLQARYSNNTTSFQLPIAIASVEVPILLGRYGFWNQLISILLDQANKQTVILTNDK